MLTVYKVTLEITDEQKVQIQKGSNIIKVAEQDGKITLWYLCDPEAELSKETFYVVSTGQQLPDTFPGLYIDTVEIHTVIEEDADGGGCFGRTDVWHVFFKRKPNVQRDESIVVDPPKGNGDDA